MLRWLPLLLALAGCSTYSAQSASLREALRRGDVTAALSKVPAEESETDVLRLLERGLLSFEAGDHEASFLLLQRADRQIEELYTKSISREAFAFLSNDATRPYEGMAHEQVLLHLYGALDLLALGREDSALVEVRRVGLRLDRLASARAEAERYRYDGFAEWLAALLYAEAGDGNGTMVSLRRALRAYEDEVAHGGLPVPNELLRDHMFYARRFGFGAEATELSARYPAVAAHLDTLDRREGEVVILYESGMVAHLEEARLDFPILKSDEDKNEAELVPAIYARGPRGSYVVDEDVELAYWLSVAIPVLKREEPKLSAARARTEGAVVESFPVHDISATAKLLFDEGQGARLLRTLARGLVKYAAKKAADEQSEGLGLITNLFNSLSERADTRSWSTLPDRIHMLRLRLPAGNHKISLEALDAHGAAGETVSYEEVEVLPGRLTFLHHRTYR